MTNKLLAVMVPPGGRLGRPNGPVGAPVMHTLVASPWLLSPTNAPLGSIASGPLRPRRTSYSGAPSGSSSGRFRGPNQPFQGTLLDAQKGFAMSYLVLSGPLWRVVSAPQSGEGNGAAETPAGAPVIHSL